MTLILLEGPDCSGKTTLANVLTTPECIFHSTYVGHDAQEKHTMDNFLAGFNCSREGKIAVLDRGWIGHDIYASVFRPSLPNADWTKRHHAIAQACRCYTVLCAPPASMVQYAFDDEQRQTGRKEMYSSTFDVARLYRYLATCLRPSDLDFDPQAERTALFDSPRKRLTFNDFNYIEKTARNRTILPGFGYYNRFKETPEQAAKRVLNLAREWEAVE